MRPWLTGLLLGAAALALAAPARAERTTSTIFGVTIHRGSVFGGQRVFDRFPGMRRFRALPQGRFEGFCCVLYPGASGDTPGIIVINAAPPAPPPAPPRPAAADAHFTIETTPSGVTIVRGPPILP